MSNLKLYAPAIVLLVWALVAAAGALAPPTGIVALLTLAAAFWLQVHEAVRRHRWRRRD